MANAKINVCVDEETKKHVESLLDEMGLNMTTAINIYLKKIVKERCIPFEISARTPLEETLAAIEEGRRIAKDDSVKGFDSVEELMASLNE